MSTQVQKEYLKHISFLGHIKKVTRLVWPNICLLFWIQLSVTLGLTSFPLRWKLNSYSTMSFMLLYKYVDQLDKNWISNNIVRFFFFNSENNINQFNVFVNQYIGHTLIKLEKTVKRYKTAIISAQVCLQMIVRRKFCQRLRM